MAIEITGEVETFKLQENDPAAQSRTAPEDAEIGIAFWHLFTEDPGNLTLQSCTFAGQPMHLAAESIPASNGSDGAGVAWGLVEATGEQTLDWSWTPVEIVDGPTFAHVFAKGVHPLAPVRNIAVQIFQAGGDVSLDIATQSGDLVVALIGTAVEEVSHDPDPNDDQTVLVDNDPFNFLLSSVVTKDATGSVTTINATRDAGEPFPIVVIAAAAL